MSKNAEDFAIFVGDLVPIVGRPVVIVTYQRHAPVEGESRRESATYWAFFTHDEDSYASALCQRMYLKRVYPRLGAKEMIERGCDEGELALDSWLLTWMQEQDHPNVEVGSPSLQKVNVETLFALYVFCADVRACVSEMLTTLDNERLRSVLEGWTAELGVNTVPLQPAVET